jgi:hypothetical protein
MAQRWGVRASRGWNRDKDSTRDAGKGHASQFTTVDRNGNVITENKTMARRDDQRIAITIVARSKPVLYPSIDPQTRERHRTIRNANRKRSLGIDGQILF